MTSHTSHKSYPPMLCACVFAFMLGCDGSLDGDKPTTKLPTDMSRADAMMAPDLASQDMDLDQDSPVMRDMRVNDMDQGSPLDMADMPQDQGSADMPLDMPEEDMRVIVPQGPLKAFPSAYGAGAEVTGGRGGVLIIVNTPDPKTPLQRFEETATTPERYEGGLYAALQHPGAAYIIFDRAMTITLGVGGTGADVGYDGIPNVRDKTLFGQSAPRGGVTITGGTLRFTGRSGDAQNLIFRYFRSRPLLNRDGIVDADDDAYTWALLFYGGGDVIVDHCSFSFAHDKAMGAFIDQNSVPENEMKRFTFSRNQLGDSHTSHYIEINPGRPEDPEDYVDHFSMLANLTVGMNRTPNVAYDGFAEIINTVNYGLMSKQSTIYHDIKLNHIGNYHAKAVERVNVPFNRIFTYDSSTPQVYTRGNYYQGLLEGTQGEDNRTIWRNEPESQVEDRFFVDAPFDPEFTYPYNPLSAADAYTSIVEDGDVGAYQYLDDEGRVQQFRDSYDTSQLEVVRTSSPYTIGNIANWVLPTLPATVRPESYDTDLDGMADAWELRRFGDLTRSYNGDEDGDGYTHIEEFMNQVDLP